MTDLLTQVRHYVPDCQDGDELEQRTALLKAREYAAMLRAQTEGEMALEHAIAAHEAAGAYCYAKVPVARLKIAVGYCRAMVQAAFLADHLEREARQ
jgi:hypothetical protein